MGSRTGLSQQIWRAFLIPAFIISVTVISGVYAARYVLGGVLIERALKDEATYYWERYKEEPGFPRPHTNNLTGYLSELDEIPEEFTTLTPGFHELSTTPAQFYIIHVTEHDGRTLYLEFDGVQVGELALYFGVVPLAGVLIVIYISGWIGYHFSRRAISPIVRLANELEELDPADNDLPNVIRQTLPHNPDEEISILSDALLHLSERIDAFVLRERNFTRDASHELRSPITVIKIASDILLSDEQLSESALTSVNRIKRSALGMEELIEALLLLARESDNALSFDTVCLNDIIDEEIDRSRFVFKDKPVKVEKFEDNQLVTEASERVLSVMIGNLIRNAFSYTDEGNVTIHVHGSSIIIEDSGAGIPDEQMEKVFKPFNRGSTNQRGGYGVGLTIVKMLSERFNWPIHMDSQLNKGTKVTVKFPNARIV